MRSSSTSEQAEKPRKRQHRELSFCKETAIYAVILSNLQVVKNWNNSPFSSTSKSLLGIFPQRSVEHPTLSWSKRCALLGFEAVEFYSQKTPKTSQNHAVLPCPACKIGTFCATL